MSRSKHPRAVEAQIRKETAKVQKRADEEKRADDEYWRDDDRTNAKKQERREQKEKKRQDLLDRKKETNALEQQEREEIEAANRRGKQGQKQSQNSSTKVTRAQIEAHNEAQQKQRDQEIAKADRATNSQSAANGEGDEDDMLTGDNVMAREFGGSGRNPNLELREAQLEAERRGEVWLEARNVEDAIRVMRLDGNSDGASAGGGALAGQSEVDMHPEKRMRAAYNEFERRRIAELREDPETARLKLSQMRQMIRKEFDKSEANPKNQAQSALTRQSAASFN